MVVYSCSECDKTFDRYFNMMRHKASMHPKPVEEMDDDGTDSNYSEAISEASDRSSHKSTDEGSNKYSNESSDEDSDDTIPQKYNIWYRLRKQALDSNKIIHKFGQVTESLTSNGMDPAEAGREAFFELLPDLRKEIYKRYTDMLLLWHYAEDDDAHTKVIETKRKLIEDEEYDEEEAVRYAVKKRKYLIQKETVTSDDVISNHRQDDQESEHSGEDET